MLRRDALSLALLLLCGAQAGSPSEIRPISADFADPRQYAYLGPLLNGVEVVSLAESIHMTREFPLIRLGMLEYLNQKLGFGMLAFEGSPVDLWATQDQFLSGDERQPGAVAQANAGLFGLWNTGEIRRLFEYERSTWSTPHPLYITAYDIQPGSGRSTQGTDAFELLSLRLKRYAPAPPGFDQSQWMASLAPLTSACSDYSPANASGIENAIATLETWIEAAAPAVEGRYPNLPHAAVLRLIPQNLRASLARCRTLGSGKRDWNLYKTTRDKLAGQFALALKAAAPGGKLTLWAHVSHLFYDDGKSSTSVGEILHDALGSRLYTIAGFALGGGTLVIYDDTTDDFGYAFAGGDGSGEILNQLHSPCSPACFLDMRGTTSPELLSPHPVWWESHPEQLALAKNFDAVFWVARVHPPNVPLAFWLLSANHYKWQLAGVAGVMLAALASFMLRKARRPSDTERGSP